MKKVGVVLSGSGFLDGSEIHEATLTLYFLDKAGVEIVCLAPDVPQKETVNHLSQKPTASNRSVLEESARIARSKIKNLKEVSVDSLDALIFPGGYGAVKNLCDFATNGVNLTVHPDVEKCVLAFHQAKKPMGFICIAPVIAAKLLGKNQVVLTIGDDPATAQAITAMGAKHQNCKVDQIIVDTKNKIVSTPAYMLGPTISKVAVGIEKLVNEVIRIIS